MTDFKAKAMGYPTSLAPTGTWPLDSRSYFESKADADAAALKAEKTSLSGTSMYYIGQHFTVYENGSVSLYYVGEDRMLHQLEDAETAKMTAERLEAAIQGKIYVKSTDDEGNSIDAYSDLSVIKITKDEYEALVADSPDKVLSNAIYVVSSDYVDAYGEQVKNVAEPELSNDAATKSYVDTSTASSRRDLSDYVNSTAEKQSVAMKAATSKLGTAIDSKIIIDGVSAEALSIIHDTADSYHQKVVAGTVLENELYIISSDYINCYDEQVKNVAAPTDLSDATPKFYVDDAVSTIEKSLEDSISAESTRAKAAESKISAQLDNVSTSAAISASMLCSEISNAVSSSLDKTTAKTLSTELKSAIDSKIYIDGAIAQTLSIVNDSADSYHQKVVAGTVLGNELYVVSSDYINCYDEQVKNVAEPELSNDAATKNYVDASMLATQTAMSAMQAKLDFACQALSGIDAITLSTTSELTAVANAVIAIRAVISALYTRLA